jgi:hypothetical protein
MGGFSRKNIAHFLSATRYRLPVRLKEPQIGFAASQKSKGRFAGMDNNAGRQTKQFSPQVPDAHPFCRSTLVGFSLLTLFFTQGLPADQVNASG